MNPTEYQKLAARTECTQFNSLRRMNHQETKPPGNDVFNNTNEVLKAIRFNHCVIGLAGEVGEIGDLVLKGLAKDNAAMMLELGDLLWYSAEGMNATGLDMNAIVNTRIQPMLDGYDNLDHHISLCLTGMCREVGELASQLQKWVYYGKYDPMDTVKTATLTGNIRYVFQKLFGWIVEFMNGFNIAIEQVMIANIVKLKARYPDKYTDERAAEENRDRAKEEHDAMNAVKPEPHGPVDAEIDHA